MPDQTNIGRRQGGNDTRIEKICQYSTPKNYTLFPKNEKKDYKSNVFFEKYTVASKAMGFALEQSLHVVAFA
jgi:hypothetical protein